ncbi:hypothetical protein [Vibrio atlanticus]|uniref:hypothetical protein n=1 Tax=Vibrio atlanticus TaxID=693153 RepID=UPI00354B9D76
MIVETVLKQHQSFDMQIVGRYLMLKKGEQVTVVAGDKSIDMPRGYVFDFGREFTQVTITNRGTLEDIELLASDIPFNAGVDGSELALRADLSTTNMKVDFKGRQPVELPPNQKVVAELENFPAVLPVKVENPLSLPSVLDVNVVGQTKKNLMFVPHATMTSTGTITGNVKREELILKAGDANKSSIWLGGVADRGYELRPGEGFVLTNGAKLEVLVPSNCKLYVSEVTA